MLSLANIKAARDRIKPVIRQTPLRYSDRFSELTDASIYLKLENIQRTGAFKLRGAMNRIATLSEADRNGGVITASAGNHAQGVAFAATRAGVDSKIVMPTHAPVSKRQSTERYGGEVILHGEDYDAAQQRAHEIADTEDRYYLHAFDDQAVMAGQGTIGLEILDACPSVETVVVPIGGGGLISGIATAIKAQKPDVRVIGVQAKGAASAPPSLAADEVQSIDSAETIADGIATRQIGAQPFEILQSHVDEVVTVSDSEIAVAITYLLEREKTLTEGAGAAALAAVLHDRFSFADNEVIVPALCGGNIDMNQLTTVLLRGLVETGRYLRIHTILEDYPGALEELVAILAAYDANIYAINHNRTSRTVSMEKADVEIELETMGPTHIESLLEALREDGFEVEVLD